MSTTLAITGKKSRIVRISRDKMAVSSVIVSVLATIVAIAADMDLLMYLSAAAGLAGVYNQDKKGVEI